MSYSVSSVVSTVIHYVGARISKIEEFIVWGYLGYLGISGGYIPITIPEFRIRIGQYFRTKRFNLNMYKYLTGYVS